MFFAVAGHEVSLCSDGYFAVAGHEVCLCSEGYRFRLSLSRRYKCTKCILRSVWG